MGSLQEAVLAPVSGVVCGCQVVQDPVHKFCLQALILIQLHCALGCLFQIAGGHLDTCSCTLVAWVSASLSLYGDVQHVPPPHLESLFMQFCGFWCQESAVCTWKW